MSIDKKPKIDFKTLDKISKEYNEIAELYCAEHNIPQEIFDTIKKQVFELELFGITYLTGGKEIERARNQIKTRR